MLSGIDAIKGKGADEKREEKILSLSGGQSF